MSEGLLVRGAEYDITVRYGTSAEQTPSSASNNYEIVCVTHGTIEYWIEDKFYKASGGDVLLIPAGTMVCTNLKQRGAPCGRYSIWMSRLLVESIRKEDLQGSFAFDYTKDHSQYLMRLPLSQFEEVYNTIEAVVAECSVENALNAELATKAMIVRLLVQINRIVYAQGEQVMQSGEKNRLVPVLSYIHQHCTDALTVDAVAEMFGYSSSHLAHSFKKQMGTSLYHYVLLRRLQIGRESMLKGTPVKEAYQMCGFGDYAGFYRAFTKEFGMSPQQYKKRHS